MFRVHICGIAFGVVAMLGTSQCGWTAPVVARDTLVVPEFWAPKDFLSLQVAPCGDIWAAALHRGEKVAILKNRHELGVFDAAGDLLFTGDHRHVVAQVQQGDRITVLIDSSAGPAFERIETLITADSSEHIAYIGLRGRLRYVVRDNVVVDSCVEILPNSLAISAVGGRLAYVVKRGEKWVLATGREDFALPHEPAAGPFVSPNGEHVMWINRISSKEYHLMQDNRGIAIFDKLPPDILPCGYSADSQHFAYAVPDGKRWQWMTDRGPSVSGDEFGPAALSADGDHLAAAVYQKADKVWTLRWDSLTVTRAKTGSMAVVGLSPDGHRTVCALVTTEATSQQVTIIVDSVASRKWDGVGRIVFSSDGRHFAYDALTGVTYGKRPLLAPRGWSPSADLSTARRVLMVDGEELPGHDQLIKGAVDFPEPGVLRVLEKRSDGVWAIDFTW